MKHLFIGLLLSKKVQIQLKNLVHDIQLPSLKCSLPHHYHITLIPPFIETKSTPSFTELKLPEIDPFSIEFTKLSYGTSPKNPTLIWVTGSTTPHLQELYETLHKQFAPSKKIKPNKHPFLLHTTLARFRGSPSNTLPPLYKSISISETISQISLIESKLTTYGSLYTILSHKKI